MKTINEKQLRKLYWPTWGRVRKYLVTVARFSAAEADAKRHEIHVEALGRDKSSKELTNADLDRVLDAFQVYLGLVDPRQSKRAVEMPRKRLIHAIEATGFPDAYLDQIAWDQHRAATWRCLDDGQLEKLKLTAIMRARARRKKEKAGGSTAKAGSREEVETVNPY